jgi:hypothetical protein
MVRIFIPRLSGPRLCCGLNVSDAILLKLISISQDLFAGSKQVVVGQPEHSLQPTHRRRVVFQRTVRVNMLNIEAKHGQAPGDQYGPMTLPFS